MEKKLLDQIDNPDDLKKLPIQVLQDLAQEIRDEIITTIAVTGGHLASSLGTVELTIALHYIFNTPYDKIIWDVGHQTYTHKILTGRRKLFHTIRQFKGLSGFTKKSESIYDPFGSGHASTSISSGLGISEARDLGDEKYKVISVIGDGSMTGGMVFEALNHAGAFKKKDLIVILNDNKMSISPNVGALSGYLNRQMMSNLMLRFRKEVQSFLESIPSVGTSMIKAVKKLEESVKALFVPGVIFEELGFRYIGPIRGHNIPELIATLQSVKQLDMPVLVHVITKKGRGYLPSEKHPSKYHGSSPFEIKTGSFKKSSSCVSYTEVFAHTMIHLAAENDKIVAITAAMLEGTGLCEFAKKFPKRCYDVGIAEQHAVTFAAGLACEGYKPVVAIYSTFLQRAFDQIIHDVCLQNLPVVFALDRAGIVGEDGPTHQGAFDLSYLRLIPNLVVMAPKNENELQHMLFTAINHDGPIAIRFPRGSGVGVKLDETFRNLDIGKAEKIVDGKDATILAIGNTAYPAQECVRLLKDEGYNVGLINMRFVKPLDHKILNELAKKNKPLITIEENTLLGGFGSSVVEYLADRHLASGKITRLGFPDIFIEQGKADLIREQYKLSAKEIFHSIKKILQKDRKPPKNIQVISKYVSKQKGSKR